MEQDRVATYLFIFSVKLFGPTVVVTRLLLIGSVAMEAGCWKEQGSRPPNLCISTHKYTNLSFRWQNMENGTRWPWNIFQEQNL